MHKERMNLFDHAKYKIAVSTLKMHDVGAKLMGGMTKPEARNFLRSMGWSERRVHKLENPK